MTLQRSIGINFNSEGSAEICLWAPLANSVTIVLEPSGQQIDLQKADVGYWLATTSAIRPGDRYWVLLDDDKKLPDPASLSQPGGVHAASEAVDLRQFSWTDTGWKNPPLQDYVIYELHTGAFTPEGTFEAVIAKIPHLKSLGITAIEIMPVGQFPGDRNWGYDGVFPFAVQNSYGGATGLKQLVDACHAQELAIVLDVVYNHIGPEGNYFPQFGPYFTPKYHTPWGDAINFDDARCDEVRRYVTENALMWFRDFHVDALRLDAVHAIKDFSPKHILQEIAEKVAALTAATGRQHHLLIECDLNDRRFIECFGMDAQWLDEFHHALRVTAGGSTDGYYADFAGITDLAKAYRTAYVYDGQYSAHRQKSFGTQTDGLQGDQFLVFSQNHDQIGNRLLGERSSRLFSFEMQKLMAGAVLVAPYIPLLFMGEEWSAPSPFLYFVSHGDPELVKAVREGRQAEFAAFHAAGEAPDPQAEATFERSKLDWTLVNQGPHAQMFSYYQELIKLRKKIPSLCKLDRTRVNVQADEQHQVLLLERWHNSQQVCCLLNFSDQIQPFILREGHAWQPILNSAASYWGGPGINESNGLQVIIQPQSIIIYTNYHV